MKEFTQIIPALVYTTIQAENAEEAQRIILTMAGQRLRVRIEQENCPNIDVKVTFSLSHPVAGYEEEPSAPAGCGLGWKNTWYTYEQMKNLDFGCYSEDSYTWTEKDGVKGCYVQEGFCDIHGLICSQLGSMSSPDQLRHPCGAPKHGS
jgi:hypothetical protein